MTQTTEASGTFTIGGDLAVNRMGFGAMRITGAGIWGEPADHDESIRVLKRTLELGINFIDTADSYGPEVSERLIAEALYPYPEHLVIATKAGLERPGPDVWESNGRPAHLRKALDGSLKRLRLERIDLLQLHRIDERVPPEDQFETLKQFQQEGKVRHIGLSEVTVDQVKAARRIVEVVTVQNRYSITDRVHEDVLDYCEREGIGFIPWFPLGAGKLTKAGGLLDQVASKLGATVGQVALAWLLKRSPVMLLIPGTSRVKHLEENVAAAALALPDHDFERLDQASREE